MSFTFTINGHTYTSDPANLIVPDGYRFIGYGYISALANLAQDIVAVAAQTIANAGGASDSAASAAQSVIDAQGYRNEASAFRNLAAQSVDDAAAQVVLAAAQKQLAADWAAKESGTVDGESKSAKQYAQDAADFAASVDIPFPDTQPLIRNDADPTKKAIFSAVGIGTGITRTINVPNKNGTMALLSDIAPPAIIREARTANTKLVAADIGKIIDVSGTFTQTFDAAAALGNGWYVWMRSAGDITLDPDGTETIDGLASFISYPSEIRLIQCDGAELRSYVIAPFQKTFTASGTFVKPPGYSCFGGLLWGAGAGGGKSGNAGFIAGGGGGGACLPFVVPSNFFGSTEVVTIGAGGAGATAAGAAGSGGNSSIGTLASYGGGAGFGDGAASCVGGSGGGVQGAGNTGSTSTFVVGGRPYALNDSTYGPNTSGHFGGGNSCSGVRDSTYGGAAAGGLASGGGTSLYGGGGGGGSPPTDATNSAGISVFGGSGGTGRSSISGVDGVAPGGGAGATRTGPKGGDGARGEARIWGIC